ncbi:TetR/AcrR family transcriptional regulator [Microbacteriaceae bacterium 4G12]
MPPKERITEEAIIETSIKLIQEGGLESFNARELAKRLNCSTQPIFSKFKSMDELRGILYGKVEKIYNQHMLEGMKNHNSFFGMGIAYIDFAKTEKNLFKMLFMSDSIKVKSVFEMIDGEDNHEIVQMISKMTDLIEENAKQLFVDIWLITHGIASVLVANSCEFSDTEIENILKDAFMGFSRQLKLKQNGKEE